MSNLGIVLLVADEHPASYHAAPAYREAATLFTIRSLATWPRLAYDLAVFLPRGPVRPPFGAALFLLERNAGLRFFV